MPSRPTSSHRLHHEAAQASHADPRSVADGRPIPLAYGLFLRESLRSLGATASVMPSSRHLSGALLDPIDFGNVTNLAELGCGTGAVTREILKRLPSGGRVFALDTNENFIRHLRQNCMDERLIPVHSGAEGLARILSRFSLKHVGAIVSSLGLTSMAPNMRARILRQICRALPPGGILTQYQYMLSLGTFRATFPFQRFEERQFLSLFFREVESRRVLWNFPPAIVFACSK